MSESVLICSFSPAGLICPFHTSFPFWDREITRKLISYYQFAKYFWQNGAISTPETSKSAGIHI
jgi:hypothetical protein